MIKSNECDYFKFIHTMKRYGIGYDYPSLKPDEGEISYSYQFSTYNNGTSKEITYTDGLPFVSRHVSNKLVTGRMKFLALNNKNIRLSDISNESIPLSISSIDPLEDNEPDYIEYYFDGDKFMGTDGSEVDINLLGEIKYE